MLLTVTRTALGSLGRSILGLLSRQPKVSYRALPLLENDRQEATLLRISPHSLALRTTEEFVPGDVLAVMLLGKTGRFASPRLVRVAEAEQRGGRWQVGS